MEFSEVLVPVTGQPVDDEAVTLACELAKPHKGLVRVLYVILVPRTLPLDAEVSEETAQGERVLQRMEALGKAQKCKLEGEILQARHIGTAVVQEAEDRKVPLIVLSLPYRLQYGVPSLGNVAPYILKHAPCRVLVSREQAHERETLKAAR